MTSAEVIKKVRTLEIKSKRLTDHMFAGEYHTAFKGRGMKFKEVREYQAGDDPRFIDWNVSARMGGVFTKLFEEERELTVYLLVDVSASSLFGTFRETKRDLITQICAVLAFSAIANNDKASLISFSDKVDKYMQPRKGRDHVLHMVKELLTFKPRSASTRLLKALDFVNHVSKHKSIVFILSDFADTGYRDVLRVAARRHDIIGIQVYDRRDKQLPRMGILQVRDAETGQTVWLDTNDMVTRTRYNEQFLRIKQDAKLSFRDAGCDLLQIATGEDYVKALQEFFIRRA
ncbi:uncharacterized protein (DUF58 family) [Filimonas zeae]|uniref:DUF58 domain-containing protein n=1 Tax=Filimonas zeae TaxID=1737353 RepID=A0A917J2K3_9BACT|nr:DUF58 domain-containing protein [Filimonas zeae]MDR6341935.1 uncharacterized protein (DUF58 family) [Filimonas zeae]GGH79760.1 hypothetical protein GCM10011379_49610 [Filimonas zeae]